jgi:hypothetical protein
MTNKLTEVTSASSKAEEIEFLNIVVSMVKGGSYLSSLFTPDMVVWTEERIRNDFTCDLLDELRGAANKVAEMSSQMEADRRDASKAYDAMEAELERRAEAIEDLNQKLQSDLKEFSAYRAQEIEHRNTIIEQENAIEEMARQIRDLKAKCWDLSQK